MNQFKNIFLFDAFLSGANVYSFFDAIPGQSSLTEMIYQGKTEKLKSKVWEEEWHFYPVRQPFRYIPKNIHLPNESAIIGCLHIIDLGVYSYLIGSFINRFGQDGQKNLHNDMADDDLNSIKWARRYGLFCTVIVLEDEEKLTFDYANQIKRVYRLSDEDILVNINTQHPDTVLAGLDYIKKRFGSRY